MNKNLRNVAIPGTGIALSIICRFKFLVYWFLFFGYPFIALCAGVVQAKRFNASFVKVFAKQLLEPDDWFSLWRMNCTLASYHAFATRSKDYEMEDKWLFLKKARENNIPVSPWLELDGFFVKHRNEEGGQGIHFYKSAHADGDWIVQKKLKNSEFLKTFLPEDAPLSTIRIVTGSKIANGSVAYEETDSEVLPNLDKYIEVFSSVFRAGLAQARTDHVSILFDIDPTGKILLGTTNNHWYKLGIKNMFDIQISTHDVTHHPDSEERISGLVFENFEYIKELVQKAHLLLMKNVPLAGWDIALTDEGILLLEVNISCNFFRGTINEPCYHNYLHNSFLYLENLVEF